MRIAFVTCANLPIPPVLGGAVETLISNICNENEIYHSLDISVFSIHNMDSIRQAKGYEYTSFYFYKQHDRRISLKNILYKLTGIRILSSSCKKLVNKINRQHFDFVLITSITYDLLQMIPSINAKVIWYLHADPLSVLPAATVKKICATCYGVISVSKFVASRVAAYIQKSRLKVLYNCSDVYPVARETMHEVTMRVRSKYGISSDEVLFTYTGRITKIKGIQELINAFKLAKLDNAKLLIVGKASTPDEKAYLEILKRSANDDVVFAGYIDHSILNEVYCASDFIVAPSICYEAAGLSVLEPQLCGVPVITTNIGGIPEYSYPEFTELVEVNESLTLNLQNAINKAANKTILNQLPPNLNVDKFRCRDFYHNFVNIMNNYDELRINK